MAFKMKYQGKRSGFPFKAADENISNAAQRAGEASAVDTTDSTESVASNVADTESEFAENVGGMIVEYGKSDEAKEAKKRRQAKRAAKGK